MQLRVATRQKAKLRIGLSGTSGSGKTYSALQLAYGMTNDWGKVALIDTENGSADLYAGMGAYNVLTLSAPFNPERYIEAIKACEKAGMEVIVIDSITHEWDGQGGLLEIHSKVPGNSFANWSKITPRHNAFIGAILQSSCHVITTVRRKQDYEMTTNSMGKAEVTKVGLKEVTREGFEYELTANLELDTAHMASASKDRTGLFVDKPSFLITPETGKQLLAWCNQGVEVIKEPSLPAFAAKPTPKDALEFSKAVMDSPKLPDDEWITVETIAEVDAIDDLEELGKYYLANKHKGKETEEYIKAHATKLKLTQSE